ncbi:hypothetical protein ENSA7_21390 [Enhygromyxa salina]|uniref:Uncharacterized protein n=2 Tax=Enhygromyxa salina TaxID=215803 RepID=A0A2S9YST8_9BACT|nr:hypothetical protein ENSA7_21390 [Enhygromyxa salina]
MMRRELAQMVVERGAIVYVRESTMMQAQVNL